MLSIQKISKAAAAGYAEYIAEQREEAQQIMAADPDVSREEAERRAARMAVERVARRDGEDVAEALHQFDRRQEDEQIGAQVGYYSLADDGELTGDRLIHVVGAQAGKCVQPGELREMLMMRDGEGHRLDDAQPKQLRALAQAVGIDGDPTADQLAALRQGLDPITGEELTGPARRLHARAYDGQQARPDHNLNGIDLTFSAPKSVSIYAAAAAATGDMDRYEKVLEAHRQAIEDTLAQAEDEGLICARRGKGGAERQKARLTGGMVKLETGSRALDPQLHGHTVLSSVVEAEDGRRSAMDSKVLFNSSKYLGVQFRRQLAAQLDQNLGLQLEADEVGTHELVGVDEDLIQQFSTRSAEIAETLSEMDAADEALRNAVAADRQSHRQAFEKQKAIIEGLRKADPGLTQDQAEKKAAKDLTPAERQKAKSYGKYLKLESQTQAARQQEATVQSRRGKDGSEADLIEHWSRNGALTSKVVQQAEEKSRQHQHARGPVREVDLFEFVRKHLTEVEGRQSFSEKEARVAIAQFAPMHWDQQRVKQAADRFLDSAGHVVRLQMDEMAGPKLASWTHGPRCFSTPQVVEAQKRIMHTADKLAERKPRQFIDYSQLAEAAESYTLTEEQQELAAAVAATDLTIVRGKAGTGKSHALKPVCEQLQAAGYEVSTFGVKKEMSYDLSREIGANRGESLTKLLMRSDDDPTMPYPGLLEAGRWAQGEPDDIRAKRRALQKAEREAGNRARAAADAGDEKAQRQANAEQAKAQKKLESFAAERAEDPTKNDLSQAWDTHLKKLKMAKMMPRGTARQIALHQLARQREKLVEAKAFAADATEKINWDTPQCWIIDEAGLMADHELDRLMETAKEHNIKLVFLGDREQGKAIGVSGAYAQMEDTYGTVDLSEIQRAKAEWERDLQARFHDLPRDPEAADQAAREIIAEYEEHGRIDYITQDDVQDAVAAGQADADDPTIATTLGVQRAADWYMDHRDGGISCVQTATRTEQAAVAEAVQARLINSGDLDPKKKTAELPLDDQTSVRGRVGEPIMIRTNLNQQGLRNGMQGEITQIRVDGSIQVRVSDGDKTITQSISQAQLRKDHAVTLAYASTIAKSQGETYDHTAVMVPADRGPVSKNDLYTALSRGKHENTAIVATSGTEERARERMVQSMQNRQEDEALHVDYINSPITREELEREAALGVTGDQAVQNIRDQRRIDVHRDHKRRAETQQSRRRTEAVATRRLQQERDAARERQHEPKRRRLGRSLGIAA